MPSTGLRGPFSLTTEKIDKEVTQKSPGAYALDATTSGAFQVNYAGRSDTDVKDRLAKHVGGKYKFFEFEYYSSAKAAFEKECNLYHDFSPSDNTIHPDRPSGSGWKCPRCKKFD
jgi:hypothetical protein